MGILGKQEVHDEWDPRPGKAIISMGTYGGSQLVRQPFVNTLQYITSKYKRRNRIRI